MVEEKQNRTFCKLTELNLSASTDSMQSIQMDYSSKYLCAMEMLGLLELV